VWLVAILITILVAALVLGLYLAWDLYVLSREARDQNEFG
jgi:hypothetical protein